jgi:predicted nucleotidyltransferase
MEGSAETGSDPASPELLDEAVRRLAALFHPQRIVLFGSRARGDSRPDSDIDLLVIAESAEPVHVRMARAQRALRGLPVPIDVFVCTPQEAETYGHWLSHTVALALREGKVVHAGA